MTGKFTTLKPGWIQPPIRRVLAIDAGSRRLKLLLAESDFGRLRILRQELIDLQAEGLVAADELKAQIQTTLDECARPPLGLAMPQHLSTAVALDLPMVADSEIGQHIQQEAVKLTGVSESRIVFDFFRTETRGNRQRFWVTLCREDDIRGRVQQLGVEHDDLCEVTTTANALLAAYRAAAPGSTRAILVDLGAATTVVVVALGGQGAFAASIQMAGDFFTRSLVRLLGVPEERAEALKRSRNLFEGPDAVPEFLPIVDGWVTELKSELQDWLGENREVARELTQFDVVVSGGGFEQLGLREYLELRSGLKVHPWPVAGQPEQPGPNRGFEVAYGTALQALGQNPQRVSLLPEVHRSAWNKRLWRQRLEAASAIVLTICLLLLCLGTWRQLSLIAHKDALLKKVQAGQEAVDQANRDGGELVSAYEALRPVFAHRQNTIDTLQMLSLLQQARSNHAFWFVLIADQQSYFTQNPTFTFTNAPGATNAPVFATERRRTGLGESGDRAETNASPARAGYIAEVCIPGEPDAARATLSQMVSQLKQKKLFSKADLLSEDLRQKAADPKVILPERHFALALEFSQSDFQQPARLKRSAGGAPVRAGPRRAGSGGELKTNSPP